MLDLNRRLIAWATKENYLRQSSDAETGAQITESMQQRARLLKHTRQAIVGIGATARANGAVTEVEHLAMRAGLMAGGEVVTPLRRLRASNADLADAVTQRPARLRPDDNAKAPMSAADIAKEAIEFLEDED